MKKIMTALAAFTFATSMTACSSADDTEAVAETAGIAGDWKVDLDSAQWENDVGEYVLADGTYNCLSCNPPFEVAADGGWHDVAIPATDSIMMEVVDDNTVRSAGRLNGEDTGSSTWTVSEDGNALEVSWTNLRGDQPVSGKTSYTRTEAGPEGSHAVSGKWTTAGVSDIDEAGLRFSFGLDGDTITSRGNSESYTATLGGDAVAIDGNDAGEMVKVERTGDNSFLETYTRDGEIVATTELTIDGDTLNGVSTDPRNGSVVRWSATRQ
ncbi:hypothetical protein [Qipengyuania huizhouensis]|uniref:hypothetical protein n=1 Tax=Qipengyuania huizhouensis TaxID=2867245 RepID=UPI001C86A331|nr:hypothetical protein [Qipengyuania huizhouensis]MBX7460894.1 hypothetical protein [Qipengyuania huizhouensis]